MGETNEETGKKVAAALALKITPVLCVGETKRGAGGEHFDVVRAQLRAGFSGVEASQTARVVVTYEPLWTIGAEKAMSPRDMHEMAIFIRKSVVDMKGLVGMNIKILYGGSVDGNNAPDMLKNGDVHGLLVGRASEDGIKLASLLEAIEEAA
jgi:triosephosphate isomerase